MTTLLKNTANVLLGISLVKLLSADLKAEIRHDGASLRDKVDGLIRESPYRAAGLAAATGALTGIMLARWRPHRTIPTRF
jgi:ElaB/YqjD/DUF883 family membrane-anchored ribosome-binding protein